jgi:hypothetical protein
MTAATFPMVYLKNFTAKIAKIPQLPACAAAAGRSSIQEVIRNEIFRAVQPSDAPSAL